MKNNGLFTGLVIGGMLGVAVALLAVNTVNVVEKNNNKEGESEKQNINSNSSNDETGKEDNGSGEGTPSLEVEEKEDNNEEEVRNPDNELKKKTIKEGTSIGEELVSKLSFSKKITQLEESLKKLREENTRED